MSDELAPLEADRADHRNASEARGRRRLNLLQDIRIAAPCDASWEAMQGDDRVRFCGQCEKNVYNLSAMARDEAEQLLQEREGSICVRLYQREDGTVLTADCAVGVRRRRRRRVAFGVAGAGLLATAASFAGFSGAQRQPVMGAAPALPQPPEPPVATAVPPVVTATPPAAVTGVPTMTPPPPPIRPAMGKPVTPRQRHLLGRPSADF